MHQHWLVLASITCNVQFTLMGLHSTEYTVHPFLVEEMYCKISRNRNFKASLFSQLYNTSSSSLICQDFHLKLSYDLYVTKSEYPPLHVYTAHPVIIITIIRPPRPARPPCPPRSASCCCCGDSGWSGQSRHPA